MMNVGTLNERARELARDGYQIRPWVGEDPTDIRYYPMRAVPGVESGYLPVCDHTHREPQGAIECAETDRAGRRRRA